MTGTMQVLSLVTQNIKMLFELYIFFNVHDSIEINLNMTKDLFVYNTGFGINNKFTVFPFCFAFQFPFQESKTFL